MASLNAYFAHRELEIPPSKRRSYTKNLPDAANIQWHRYIKNQITFVTALKSNTEKDKQRDALLKVTLFFTSFREFDLCRFSADFVVCVNMVPQYGEPYRIEFAFTRK